MMKTYFLLCAEEKVFRPRKDIFCRRQPAIVYNKTGSVTRSDYLRNVLATIFRTKLATILATL